MVKATYMDIFPRVALDGYASGAVVLTPSEDGGWNVGFTEQEGGPFVIRFVADAKEIRKFAQLILAHVK